jgi:dUTP pyrophosphatase
LALLIRLGRLIAITFGESWVALCNFKHAAAYILTFGERIAQLVISKVEIWSAMEVGNLPETERGAGGFGSTG